MRVLFIGDVFGRPGRLLLKGVLPGLVDKEHIDFVIANGENAAGGFGITEKTATELFSCGVDCITTGNHVWDKKDVVQYIARNERLLRPLNYPQGVPGAGSGVYTLRDKTKIGVINLSGRVFMTPIDCPFRTAAAEVQRLSKEAKTIIVDMHAEATSEKLALGYYLDGKVSAVVGTHTHVQTADERLLPGGTAYITDVGMTGPIHSVIGVKVEQIIEKFLYQIPMRYEVAPGGCVFSAVVVDINNDTGNATAIKRLMISN
ncbi:MAG: TIGR00282 family metallophosphoesterase [Candidatus Magnetobacterium sp. LHC-1]|uniref:TIGR00282 family metallophosphoesterase n=1 Tax=Candidatus Magnetobacterium casense TaxID=1455061 RepID=A0ABS6S1P9_9BACT|nr:TIGR00282 family metallophosphoesterase [Candidatus Magnetobacterium casensis]MBV6342323.1 TIGR00282 family metallophosphoesterase [Candidatus Magnetobacterium casensis]